MFIFLSNFIDMKSHLCYILLILQLFSYAQEGKAIYNQIFINSEMDLNKDYELVFNSDQSVYIELGNNNQQDNISKKEEDFFNRTIEFNTSEVRKKQRYYNFNDEFYFIENFFDKAKLVQENMPLHKWELIDSTKIINNFTCHLAKTNFRGRDYAVWYTNEIPVSYGPWKLNGLSGLILEVYDSKMNLHIQIKHIEISERMNDSRLKFNKSNFKEAITIDQLKEFIKNENEKILTKINSQLPKGVKPFKIDKDCKDCNDALEDYTK